jgi:hypothetical protein
MKLMQLVGAAGALLGSLMCSLAVDSLPIGTETKVNAYLYGDQQAQGFIGGVHYAIAVIENNAIKEFLAEPVEFYTPTNQASFAEHVNQMLSSHVEEHIAPRGAGEYGIWVFAFDGLTGAYTQVADFKRFMVTGTPGSISYPSTVTNVNLVRRPKLSVLYQNAERIVIRGEGFTHDSGSDSSLLTKITNIAGEVVLTHIHIPREVSTNTVGVVEVTLKDGTIERFALESGIKVPNAPTMSVVCPTPDPPKVSVTAAPGTYLVESSTNLVDWQTLGNVTITYTKGSLLDTPGSDRKFYRVKYVP